MKEGSDNRGGTVALRALGALLLNQISYTSVPDLASPREAPHPRTNPKPIPTEHAGSDQICEFH